MWFLEDPHNELYKLLIWSGLVPTCDGLMTPIESLVIHASDVFMAYALVRDNVHTAPKIQTAWSRSFSCWRNMSKSAMNILDLSHASMTLGGLLAHYGLPVVLPIKLILWPRVCKSFTLGEGATLCPWELLPHRVWIIPRYLNQCYTVYILLGERDRHNFLSGPGTQLCPYRVTVFPCQPTVVTTIMYEVQAWLTPMMGPYNGALWSMMLMTQTDSSSVHLPWMLWGGL